MSTSNTRAKHLRSTVGKIAMAFAFASVISGISLVPAFGQDYERRQGQRRPEQQRPAPQERGWQARERQDARRWHGRERQDARHWRGREWRDERRWRGREWRDARRWRGREWRDARGRRTYQPYGYSAPFYPPPLVFAPPPLPGIRLFFPFHIR